jgi:hypothetical protein
MAALAHGHRLKKIMQEGARLAAQATVVVGYVCVVGGCEARVGTKLSRQESRLSGAGTAGQHDIALIEVIECAPQILGRGLKRLVGFAQRKDMALARLPSGSRLLPRYPTISSAVTQTWVCRRSLTRSCSLPREVWRPAQRELVTRISDVVEERVKRAPLPAHRVACP